MTSTDATPAAPSENPPVTTGEHPPGGHGDPPAPPDPATTLTLPPINPHDWKVAIFSAICGFLLILIAWIAPRSDSDFLRYRWPLMAVGMSIIMGAAGAQVVAKLKWLVAGGAAAMVLVFAYVLKPDPLPPSAPYLYGYVRTTGELQSLVLNAGVPLLVGHRGEGTEFQFFGLDTDLRGEYFWIQARNKEGVLPKLIIIGCLKTELLRKQVGNKDGVDLSLSQDQKEQQLWYLQETGKPDRLGDFGNPACAPKSEPPIKGAMLDSTPSQRAWGFIMPAAFAAQGAPYTGDPKALISSLRSPDFTVQTQTQSAIAGMRNPGQIRALVQLWETDVPPPDVIPNLLIAWVQAIRGDRVVASYIGQAIPDALMSRVVDLAGNPDRLVRFNATEFISWLLQATRWPTQLPPSQVEIIGRAVVAPLTSHDIGILNNSPQEVLVYNLLVAIKNSACLREQNPLDNRLYGAVSRFLSSADDPNIKASDRTKNIADQILTSLRPIKLMLT